MKSTKNRSYSLTVTLLVTALLTAFTAVSFALAATNAPSDSVMKTDSQMSTHVVIWPWNILDESASSPALELIKDTEIMNKDILNSFAKNLLISSSHSTVPYSAIESTDFSDEIMITEEDFYIWMKDRVVKAYNNEEFITGFFGFSGEYNLSFSAYCIRRAALSESDVWTEYTKDEIIDLFTNSERSKVHYTDPYVSDLEEYINIDGSIYVAESTMINMTISYIYRIMALSGFESASDDFLPGFADAVNVGGLRAYKNGDLLMLYFYDTVPFNLYLFYDLGTETYCGWARN